MTRFSPRSRRWPLVLVACAACGAAPRSDAGAADSLRLDSPRAAARTAHIAPPPPPRPDSTRQEIRAVHTTLRAEECTTLSVDEEGGGGSTQRCPGTAGYTLLALDGDARASITVVDPAGGEHPLDYWERVTGGFSSLGEEAEWRVRGQGAAAVPIALIVPLKANEHPDDPERLTRYRVIAKITPAETCVTHSLPGDTPDAQARRLADASAGAPCQKPYSEP